MKYLLRLIVIPMVYIVCFAFLTSGVASIDALSPLVKSIVGVVCLLLYMFVIGSIMIKEGQDAYGVLLANDAQRRHIVETGIIVDFDESNEYKAWRGFVVGLICCIPLIVMVLMHTIAFPRGDTSRISIICEILYGTFYSIGRTYHHTNESGFYIGAAIILVALPLITGIPYMIGAHARRKQQENIRRMNDELHGGKR